MKAGQWLVTTLLFAVTPPLLAQNVVAPSHSAVGARVKAAVDRIQSDPSYQLEFPAPRPPDPPRESNWLDRFFNWLGNDGRWLVNGLFVVLIAAAVLFILYLTVPSVRDAVDHMLGRWCRKPADDDRDDDAWAPDHIAARNLLAEADALANQGRFAEAVHMLMGRSVEDIMRRRPGALRPALTARAIALLDDLPPPARSAFGQIMGAVERSLWARQPIAAPEWSQIRAAYEDFAFGAHWRPNSNGVAA